MSKDIVVARINRAVSLLSEAKTAQQAKQVADLARAAEVYAQRQKLGDDAIREATAIKVDALTKLGEFLKAIPHRGAGPGRGHKGKPKTNSEGELVLPLPDEVSPKESSDAQALADLKAENPQVHEQVRQGQLSVPAAAAQVRRQKREAKRRTIIENVPVIPAEIAERIGSIANGDCVEFLRSQEAGSIDLVFGSPPYEDARLYLEDGHNYGIARDTEAWVAWMVEVFEASLHACKGLVAFVLEGRTEKYRWSASPALLMAALHNKGIHLRKPPIFHRVGIPGSGGPDWLRNDYEFIVCATNGGQLPWSDNTALGEPCKYEPGGDPSHRTQDGSRVNNGYASMKDRGNVGPHRARMQAGRVYVPPEKANPGNVIKCNVGGGAMGNHIAHENEAPFPESLAKFFVLSFCPPGGMVCDPFCGSGTTLAVAVAEGRRACGCDLRPSQVELTKRRLSGVTPPLPMCM